MKTLLPPGSQKHPGENVSLQASEKFLAVQTCLSLSASKHSAEGRKHLQAQEWDPVGDTITVAGQSEVS